METTYIHPEKKTVLQRDGNGDLFCLKENDRHTFACDDGCYDFVTDPRLKEMRKVYDESYSRWPIYDLTLADITKPWFDRTMPWNQTMLRELGPLAGKTILLLGNGMQFKEYYFLHLGARVVYTDLSLAAVKRAQMGFRKSSLWEKYRNAIQFHAVDGKNLPFADESFDVIYGHKFVAFVDDLKGFLSEVKRCLRPGGICRFSDDAHSPFWDAIRRRVMQPLKTRVLWKSMSPLDKIRSQGSPTSEFGFREEVVGTFVPQVGFSKLVFLREYFFLRVAQMCWAKLFTWKATRLRFAKPIFLLARWIDERLVNTKFMRVNALHLIWGYDK